MNEKQKDEVENIPCKVNIHYILHICTMHKASHNLLADAFHIGKMLTCDLIMFRSRLMVCFSIFAAYCPFLHIQIHKLHIHFEKLLLNENSLK